jgi:FtsZ-binding cell division protein ZapB
MTDHTDLIARLRKYGPRTGPLHVDIRLDAADAIEALQVECERLREERSALLERIRQLQEDLRLATVDAALMEAERNDTQKDAKRYRHIRQHDRHHLMFGFQAPPEQLDAAIDAAMKEKRDE